MNWMEANSEIQNFAQAWLEWFKLYLSDRYQFVAVIEEITSSVWSTSRLSTVSFHPIQYATHWRYHKEAYGINFY